MAWTLFILWHARITGMHRHTCFETIVFTPTFHLGDKQKNSVGGIIFRMVSLTKEGLGLASVLYFWLLLIPRVLWTVSLWRPYLSPKLCFISFPTNSYLLRMGGLYCGTDTHWCICALQKVGIQWICIMMLWVVSTRFYSWKCMWSHELKSWA